jgi:hypothetical protein
MDSTFKFDDNFKSKLVILGVAVLIFAVSLMLFQASDFHFVELFDLSSIQLLIPKLYSVSFILFIITYGLVLALSSFYSYKLSTMQTLFSAVFVIIGLIFSVVYPSYISAFIILSLAPVIAAFLNSKSEKLELGSSYNSVSRSLYVILILGTIAAFIITSSNQAYYFNYFINSTASLAPQAAGSVAGMCVNALSNVNYSNYISQSEVMSAAQTFYDSNRQAIISGANNSTVISSLIPTFETLNSSQQQSIANLYEQSFVNAINLNLQGLKTAISNNTSTQTPSNQSVESALSSLPLFNIFQNNFALITALSILAALALLIIVFKVVAFVFLFILIKI